MNVLFLSLLDFDSFDERNIYSDLLRVFIKNGHRVYCISPVEKRKKQETRLLTFGDSCILRLKIGNTQKTNLIEKGISTLRIEPLFIQGIKTFFSNVKFDFVLYATPPVTFAKVIRFVKKRDGAKSYLMLKDIFPQNSVDLGMLQKSGIKCWIYRFFRSKEKKMYDLSDRIGCMSPANAEYLLRYNPQIASERVGLCPNSVEVQDMRVSTEERNRLRRKYGIPQDRKVLVYGGNLGRPQDVPFIIRCLEACAQRGDTYFVIAGSGTDRHLLEAYVESKRPGHVKLFDHMPKDEYDKMIACCDVGLIFLDHRFTIPNFPSRLLSYMQAGLPVLACTDTATDIGKTIIDGNFGWWCESTDPNGFAKTASDIDYDSLGMLGENAFGYLQQHYTVEHAYNLIFENAQSNE